MGMPIQTLPLKPLKLLTAVLKLVAKHLEIVLISGLIMVAALQYYMRPQSQSLAEILDSGVLRVLIADEPDSVYVFNRQNFGFEYELLKAYADEIDVALELDVVPYGELFALLEAGEGDIVVGGVLDSAFVNRVSTPTIAWYQAQTTVVYRRGTKRPKKIEDLDGAPVLASARYFQIDELSALNLVDDHRSEYTLLNAVNNGAERYVLSTNYRARNAKHYLPNLNRAFILSDTLGVVWALPKQYDQALLESLNGFLARSLERNLPDQLAEDYLTGVNRLSTYDALAIHRKIETALPEFEYAFRKAARRGGVDWQLLAAMAYQESRWSNDATSPTGVRGVMQLTTETAEFLGVTDRMDMTQSIDAAARYLSSLRKRLPNAIKEPERTWFAVAAYNMGLKHVQAVYRRARAQGLDATQWSNVASLLPELYGKPFPQGVQAQSYVERVQIFTDILRFYDLHQRDTDTLQEGVIAKKNG